jgi:plastocyanin
MGNNSKKGDSWYTEKKGESFSQQVTAEPGTLYFICAIHPGMQGRTTVLPAGS